MGVHAEQSTQHLSRDHFHLCQTLLVLCPDSFGSLYQFEVLISSFCMLPLLLDGIFLEAMFP